MFRAGKKEQEEEAETVHANTYLTHRLGRIQNEALHFLNSWPARHCVLGLFRLHTLQIKQHAAHSLHSGSNKHGQVACAAKVSRDSTTNNSMDSNQSADPY
jgi:hypothetical protein